MPSPDPTIEKSQSTLQVNITRVKGSEFSFNEDILAVEEPLEIRLAYGPNEARLKKTVSITMRTPGADFELAAGFLFTEGILRERDWLRQIEFCGGRQNVVRVELAPQAQIDLKKLDRHFYTSSSCGVCGKTSIEALQIQNPTWMSGRLRPEISVKRQLIHDLPNQLLQAQGLFASTGGIHASAIFDLDGQLLLVREDVGRHNALDKVIGHFFLQSALPLDRAILLVSGRASFELVQKAAMAGIQIFVAVGAPSSLAVQLAQESNMTLLGFTRDRRFNIYHAAERIRE